MTLASRASVARPPSPWGPSADRTGGDILADAGANAAALAKPHDPAAPADLAPAADLAAAAGLAGPADLAAGPEALLLVAALTLATLAWCLATPRPLTVAAAGTSAAATAALWVIDAVPAGGWLFLALAVLGVVLEVRGSPGVVVAGLGAGGALLFAGHVLHAVPDHLVVAVLSAAATVAAALWAGRTVAASRGGTKAAPAGTAPVGAVGFVLEADGQGGRAVVAAAVWPVRSPGGPLVAGSRVEVLAEAEGVLLVAPARAR